MYSENFYLNITLERLWPSESSETAMSHSTVFYSVVCHVQITVHATHKVQFYVKHVHVVQFYQYVKNRVLYHHRQYSSMSNTIQFHVKHSAVCQTHYSFMSNAVQYVKQYRMAEGTFLSNSTILCQTGYSMSNTYTSVKHSTFSHLSRNSCIRHMTTVL